jgi:hypothetical protein
MSFLEEQEQELEALGYIFEEDQMQIEDKLIRIHMKSEHKFEQIKAEEEEEEEDIELFIIEFEFTPEYPSVPPLYELKSNYLYPDELAQIVTLLESEIENLLGIAMIYSIATFLKDEIENLITTRNEQLQEQEDRRKILEEEQERLKYEGTRVNKESFLEWKVKFGQEAHLNKKLNCFETLLRIENVKKRGKTGRMLFEQGQSVEDDVQEDVEDVEIIMDKLLLEDEEENVELHFEEE